MVRSLLLTAEADDASSCGAPLAVASSNATVASASSIWKRADHGIRFRTPEPAVPSAGRLPAILASSWAGGQRGDHSQDRDDSMPRVGGVAKGFRMARDVASRWLARCRTPESFADSTSEQNQARTRLPGIDHCPRLGDQLSDTMDGCQLKKSG